MAFQFSAGFGDRLSSILSIPPASGYSPHGLTGDQVWEINKARMLDEILARQAEETRMIKDEVQRERQFSHRMAQRLHEVQLLGQFPIPAPDRFSSYRSEPRVGDEVTVRGMAERLREVKRLGLLPPHAVLPFMIPTPETKVGEKPSLPIDHGLETTVAPGSYLMPYRSPFQSLHHAEARIGEQPSGPMPQCPDVQRTPQVLRQQNPDVQRPPLPISLHDEARTGEKQQVLMSQNPVVQWPPLPDYHHSMARAVEKRQASLPHHPDIQRSPLLFSHHQEAEDEEKLQVSSPHRRLNPVPGEGLPPLLAGRPQVRLGETTSALPDHHSEIAIAREMPLTDIGEHNKDDSTGENPLPSCADSEMGEKQLEGIAVEKLSHSVGSGEQQEFGKYSKGGDSDSSLNNYGLPKNAKNKMVEKTIAKGDSSASAFSGKCFRCGVTGHRKYECPVKNAESKDSQQRMEINVLEEGGVDTPSVSKIICGGCGKSGHSSNVCHVLKRKAETPEIIVSNKKKKKNKAMAKVVYSGCGKNGHSMNVCRVLKKTKLNKKVIAKGNAPNPALICYQCGEEGHRRFQCLASKTAKKKGKGSHQIMEISEVEEGEIF